MHCRTQSLTAAIAFDKAVVSSPPFDAVVHTASPYHFNSKDNKKELLDPAINGTVGLLNAVHQNAPTVKRVVITSSSAAILDQSQPTKIYSEDDWCPVTEQQALIGPADGYRASKTFAVSFPIPTIDKRKMAVAEILPVYRKGPHGSLLR